MPSKVDDRKKRLIAFIAITIIFVVSIVALLYWVVNVATARINSRKAAHFNAFNPLNVVAGKRAFQTSAFSVSGKSIITAWQVF